MELKERVATVVAVLGVYGTLAFGAQRVAYERFYEKFGLSPEDVGINAALVLQQTGGGLAFVTAYYVVPAAFAVALVLGVAKLTAKNQVKFKLLLKIVLWTLLAVVVFASAYVFVLNHNQADDAAKCAAKADGQPVRTLRVGLPLLGFEVTRLGIRAELARVTIGDTTKNPLPKVWFKKDGGRTVLYLGTANSTMFIFDRTKKRTYRVPASSAVVSVNTTAPRFDSSKGCK